MWAHKNEAPLCPVLVVKARKKKKELCVLTHNRNPHEIEKHTFLARPEVRSVTSELGGDI